VGGDPVGAEKVGCSAETIRNGVRQAERDDGRRPGPTSEELDELKALRRENAFFAAELDRPHRR
jgi:transposase